MGLCKCPKRRVTNQFCFEHRVNVCEYCMVTSHPKVIWSYSCIYIMVIKLSILAILNKKCYFPVHHSIVLAMATGQ